jgi:hypothetical protein
MLFDLFFIAGVLTTIFVLFVILVMLFRRRRKRALRWAQVLGVSWLLYVGIVALVAASTPQRIFKPGEELCFDEMCFSIVDVHRSNELGPVHQVTKAQGIFYVVSVRVHSRSRGRPQRENGIRARLWANGKYYDSSERGEQAYISSYGPTAKLTERLIPGQSIESVQVFDVPRGISGLGLVIDHGLTPGYLVIGESPVFHKPTIIQLN